MAHSGPFDRARRTSAIAGKADIPATVQLMPIYEYTA